MNLRPYQVTALENIWKALQCEQAVLLEAACSAGKTLLFSKIIQRLLAENPSFRVLILMDREILVTQTREKILKLAPELALNVGIVCASVSNTKILDRKITIASRQSLSNQLDKFSPVNLIVIDECHLMSVPHEDDGDDDLDQFGTIIQTLKGYNSKTRLLGVTATPYRLNSGYIYGTKNIKGSQPYFSDVHHRITVSELQAIGFLAPLVGKTIHADGMEAQLDGIRVTAGEYNLLDLSNLMTRSIHINSAVEAWKAHALDRKKTIAFCVTIAHAEKLSEAFSKAGIPSIAIHSEQDDLTGYANMQALHNGDGKVFCSVGKLTTGMDVVDIDCIIMARPTKSAALYKQMLGRGQRIAHGKTDCLVLDLVGNNNEFGTDLDRIKVKYKETPSSESVPIVKTCPQCEATLHPAVRICPDCQYEFISEEALEAEAAALKDVEYGIRPPVEMYVSEMFVSAHVAKKTGKTLLRVRLVLGEFTQTDTNLWLCFPDDGYTGYAVQKGRDLWTALTCGITDYPMSVAEAMERENEILKPWKVVVDMTRKYPEVLKVIEEEVPF